MRVIILAAGEGTRLQPHTKDRPKCLVQIGGRSLLEHQTRCLRALGLTDVSLVTGYQSQLLENLGYRTILNPSFAVTNMVASLMCARTLLNGEDDVLVVYGDIIFERRVLQPLLESSAPLSLGVNQEWYRLWQRRMADPLSDAESLRLDQKGNVVEIGKKTQVYEDVQGQYMGLICISRSVAPLFVRAYDELPADCVLEGRDKANTFMTAFLQYLVDKGWAIKAVPVDGGWLEVDSAEDLELYRRLYLTGELKQYCNLDGQ